MFTIPELLNQYSFRVFQYVLPITSVIVLRLMDINCTETKITVIDRVWERNSQLHINFAFAPWAKFPVRHTGYSEQREQYLVMAKDLNFGTRRYRVQALISKLIICMNFTDLFNLFKLQFLISKVKILTSGFFFVTVVNTVITSKQGVFYHWNKVMS